MGVVHSLDVSADSDKQPNVYITRQYMKYKAVGTANTYPIHVVGSAFTYSLLMKHFCKVLLTSSYSEIYKPCIHNAV